MYRGVCTLYGVPRGLVFFNVRTVCTNVDGEKKRRVSTETDGTKLVQIGGLECALIAGCVRGPIA